MTEALVIFGQENEHPLAWVLNRKCRHVWVSILDLDRGTWTGYDWHQGNPILRFDAVADYDLETYWRSQGHVVLRVETGSVLPVGPWMLNNCVGHTKLILGIRCGAVTPHGLYQYLLGQTMWQRLGRWLKHMSVVPGGGGSAPAAPPRVAPTGYRYVDKKSDTHLTLTKAGKAFNKTQTGDGGEGSEGSPIRERIAKNALAGLQQSFYGPRGEFDEIPGYTGPDQMVYGQFDHEGMGTGPLVKASTLNPYQDAHYEAETTQVLELIPGYTQAGPDTAVGYANGPPGPATVVDKAADRRAVVAAEQAAKLKKAPAKPTSSQARAGSGGGGTSTGSGDLSDDKTTNRSLLG